MHNKKMNYAYNNILIILYYHSSVTMIQWQAYRILYFIILLVVPTNCIIMWDSLSIKYCVLFEYTGKNPTTAII